MKRERLLMLWEELRILRGQVRHQGRQKRRSPRPSLRGAPLDVKRAKCAEAILEKLLEGPCTQWKLADYAGRCSIGYAVALSVMEALLACGVLRATQGTGLAWRGRHFHLAKRRHGPTALTENCTETWP